MKPGNGFSLFYVQEISDNCKSIKGRIADCSMTRDFYASSALFQDVLMMPMLRICEIAKLYRVGAVE